MKPLNSLCRGLALGAALITTAVQTVNAASYTWTGAVDGNWSNGTNWLGTPLPPSGGGHFLTFQGATQLSSTNNAITGVTGITFTSNAGSFVLNGDGFDLNGTIRNESQNLQTINNAIRLTNHNSVYATGDIRLNGGISQDGSSRNFYKYGYGTLFLGGSNTYTGETRIYEGKLVLDIGQGAKVAGTITYGYAGQVGVGGTLEFLGGPGGITTGSTGAIQLGAPTVRNQIVLNPNGGGPLTITANSLANFGTSYTTLQVILEGGSTLKVNTLGTGLNANGFSKFVTVKKDGVTGFSAWDSGTKELGRVTGLTNLPATGGNTTINYSTGEDLTLTNNTQANSLTITAGGTMATTGPYNLVTNAILMQEGTTDYTIKAAQLGSATGGTLIVHQHSVAGNLIVESNLNSGSGTTNPTGNNVIKSGEGAMVFKGTGNRIAGFLEVQQGDFRLEGSLADIATVRVRDDGILSGTGTLGGGTKWTSATESAGTRYSDITVYHGGTVDASGGLQVHGSLIMNTGSSFKVDLNSADRQVFAISKDPLASGNIVTLNGDLKLTLGYAPLLDSVITLLEIEDAASKSYTGQFATVNGVALDIDNRFTLGYGGADYQFQLNYGEHVVYLTTTAVPEPGAVSLMVGGLVGLGLLARRKRSK